MDTAENITSGNDLKNNWNESQGFSYFNHGWSSRRTFGGDPFKV